MAAFIVKASTVENTRLRIHIRTGECKTLCGQKFTACQEDLAGPANCKSCHRIAHKKLRPRSIIRLNGRKVSVNQTKLIE
jgi:hypothetical protein